MTTAFVGLGANLGDPRGQVLAALDALDGIRETRIAARSSLYRSAPLGYDAQPDFVNAVAQIETELEAGSLLEALQQIENRHGRARSFANAPRTLDLDLLLYGARSIAEPSLVVPHPRMHERAFVLAPLLEISPDAVIPALGPAREWLLRCTGQEVERIA